MYVNSIIFMSLLIDVFIYLVSAGLMLVEVTINE